MNRYEFYSNLQTYKKQHEDDSLSHYGIIGQKWGQRRWQNYDGTFNTEGKIRYFGSQKAQAEQNAADERIGGYVADHFHKKIINKSDKNTLKKIKKYPDIYNTEGLSDEEILQAIRRVAKVPNGAAYGRAIRQELYNTQLNKTRSKYYESNAKDISEDNLEDQKIGGLFSKKSKINPKYQNEDGSLTEEGKEFFAQNNDKKIKKNIDMNKYHAWKDEMTKDNIFDDFEKLNDFAKDLGIEPASGIYSWENNMRTVLKTNKELFDTIEGRKAISDNVDNIKKLSKAIDDHDTDTYNSVLSEINEKDRTTIDLFTKKIKDVKDWYKEAEETMNEVNSSQTQNIKKYMENIWGDPKIRYDKSDYHNEGKVSYPGKYDLEDYVKGNSKASKSIKELDKNADAHFDKILDKLYNNLMNFSGTLDVWDEDHNKLTKSEFKNYMKDQKNKLINSGSVSDNGNINLYLNDANLYWGHVFGIDYNPLTGEFNYRGIEG